MGFLLRKGGGKKKKHAEKAGVFNHQVIYNGKVAREYLDKH